jgi:D-inositol-3-phosphate glycosyltransferase
MISEHASPLAALGGVDSGGQNVYVAQIAKNLARLGYLVDVFTRRDQTGLPEIIQWEKRVRVIHVTAGPAKFIPKEKLLPYMEQFTAFMQDFIHRQKRPYDLVHANFWMSAMVAANLKERMGLPFVVTFHALGRVRRLHQGSDDGFPDERFQIEEQVMAEADRIIAECPQDELDMRYLYQADPAKIVVVPCGFDPTEFWPLDKTLARRALGIPEDEKVILQLGRMVPRKGVDTVIRGFARLEKDYGIRGRLLIVGGDSDDPDPKKTPEIGRLQKIAKAEGVADRVTFFGQRKRETLKHYYSAADAFVSLPWYEPFGITPLEAMACGTPVIGAKVGGIKYTVCDGETGYLIPPDDPEAMSERLAHLCQNQGELKAFGQNAVRRVNDLFTWRKVTETMSRVYEEIITGNSNNGNHRLKSGARTDPEHEEAFSLNIQRGFEEAIKTLQLSQEILAAPVVEAANAIAACFARGNKVMVCGNGGSAADSQHFSGELLGRFVFPGRRSLPVMALTADTAFITAWSNDVGYEDIFARQVQAFGQPGDLLVGISTTGRSTNLIHAFNAARALDIDCVALLGGDGGDLLALANIGIVVPSSNSQRIQEVHTLILHLVCELVESRFIPEPLLSDKSLVKPVLSGSKNGWVKQTAIPIQMNPSK